MKLHYCFIRLHAVQRKSGFLTRQLKVQYLINIIFTQLKQTNYWDIIVHYREIAEEIIKSLVNIMNIRQVT